MVAQLHVFVHCTVHGASRTVPQQTVQFMRGKHLQLQVVKFHNDIGCNWCSVVHELWNVAHSTQAIIAHSTGQHMHNHDGSSSGHKMKPSFRAQKLETDCPSLFSWSPIVARNPVHDVVPERVLELGPFGAHKVSHRQLAMCTQRCLCRRHQRHIAPTMHAAFRYSHHVASWFPVLPSRWP